LEARFAAAVLALFKFTGKEVTVDSILDYTPNWCKSCPGWHGTLESRGGGGVPKQTKEQTHLSDAVRILKEIDHRPCPNGRWGHATKLEAFLPRQRRFYCH